MDLNKVMIIGRVTQDPEVRAIQSGTSVANFAVATNRQWSDNNGQKQEKAEFHNIVAWRKLAEIAQQYVKKGMKLYVEGRLETRSWDDPNGVKKYRTEIIATNFIMLDSRGNAGGGDTYSASPAQQAAPASVSNNEAPAPAVSNSSEEITVEDIPF